MESEQLASTVPLEIEKVDHGFIPVPGPTPSKMTYVPMFIRQKADYNFGETVTHEDYNAKFNIVAESLDHYAEVLFNLFNETDPEHAYHIPYLDNAIQDLADATNREVERLDERITTQVDRLDGRIDELREDIDTNTSNIEKIFETLDDHEGRLQGIVSGDIIVGRAARTQHLDGIDEQGPYRYYGTNKKGEKGFHDMPPAIYADFVGENEFVNPVDVDGIYYVPGSNSVAESMLTPELREKVNDKVTIYPQLGQLPQINGVTILGNMSYADLGIQPAGDYLTYIPSEYVVRNELNNYATVNALNGVNSTATSALNTANSVSNSLSSFQSTVRSTYNRIGVNYYVSNPIVGDLYIAV